MAGKPIQTIHHIIHGDKKSSGKQNAATQSTDGKLDKSFEDQFLDSIRNASKRLKIEQNCNADLFDFLSNTPFNSGINTGNLIASGMSAIGVSNPFSTDSIGSNICLFTSKAVTTLDFYIELALKQVIILFRRIDAYKTKLEGALLNFNNDIKRCLINTLLDAKNLLNRTINVVSDFDTLEDLMIACPCIEDILRNMFNLDCFEDNKGNPSAIVNCLENIGFGADEALCYVNSFVNEAMKNVGALFNAFDNVIKATMDSLLIPFRALVKQYCLLLTTKVDVTFLVKPAKKIGFDCLFLYTLEKNRLNIEYPAMSILDIINTYRFWVNCFNTICSSFSDELKRKIKAYNEELRLNFKYWNDPNIVDIFISCLFISNGNNSTRSSTVREVFSRFKDENGKAVFTGVADAFKDMGKFPITDIINTCSADTDANGNVIGISSEENINDGKNSTTDSIVNSDGLEGEEINSINPTLLFKKEVENLLILMIKNIGGVVSQDGYEEIFSELIEWEINYKKNQSHLDAINDVNESIKAGSDSSVVIDTREGLIDEVEDKVPTYLIIDDYSELNGNPKPSRNADEELVDYYARWFDLQKS